MRLLALLGLAFFAPLVAAGTVQARPQRGHGTAVRPKHGKAVAGTKHLTHSKSISKSKSKSTPKRGKARRRPGKRREAPPQMPSRLELTAVDLVTGTAHLDVVGTTRVPSTRLFILTDQTGRRFVPSFAECHPPPGVTVPEPSPGADGSAADDEEEAGPELPATTRWRCSLTIPRLYRRTPLASLGMEWGNMTVAARGETVQRLWGEARAAAPLSAVAERPHAADSPAGEPTPFVRALPLLPEEAAGLDDDPSEPPPAETAKPARDSQPAE